MDARTPPREERFLPAVAAAISEWFYAYLKNDPDDGTARCVAVSDIDMNREFVPTLPLVLVAFIRSVGEQLTRNSSSEFTITDTFVVDFWMKPTRIKSKGAETPYWNYYPYEIIRDRLIAGFIDWVGPNGERVAYRGMHVEADPLAARLTFTFLATFQWCYNEQRYADMLVDIGFRLCEPEACVPDPCEQIEDELCRPCP
jgi:hypothetical protein